MSSKGTLISGLLAAGLGIFPRLIRVRAMALKALASRAVRPCLSALRFPGWPPRRFRSDALMAGHSFCDFWGTPPPPDAFDENDRQSARPSDLSAIGGTGLWGVSFSMRGILCPRDEAWITFRVRFPTCIKLEQFSLSQCGVEGRLAAAKLTQARALGVGGEPADGHLRK